MTGRDLFEACMAERLLNDVRGWDRRETEEEFGGSIWKGFIAGLTDVEKAKWDRAARRAVASAKEGAR